jgi:hypothetical protein
MTDVTSYCCWLYFVTVFRSKPFAQEKDQEKILTKDGPGSGEWKAGANGGFRRPVAAREKAASTKYHLFTSMTVRCPTLCAKEQTSGTEESVPEV